jgi:serine/threonine protein kinase
MEVGSRMMELTCLQEHLFFVKEYASGGSLVTQLQQAGVFTEETAQFYTAQIPLALKFLHKHGIFHH